MRPDTLDEAVTRATAGEEFTLTRDGQPVAVLIGAARYDELTALVAGGASPEGADHG